MGGGLGEFGRARPHGRKRRTGPVWLILKQPVRASRVRRIVNGWLPAGESVVTWDGRDTGGARVPAGVYFARFEGVDRAIMRRIVRVE